MRELPSRSVHCASRRSRKLSNSTNFGSKIVSSSEIDFFGNFKARHTYRIIRKKGNQ